MQYVRRISSGVLGAFMLLCATSALAAGTAVNTPVTNSVTLNFSVNGNAQSDSADVTFNVDRKLVVDVTTTDADWVTVVPGQSVTSGASGIAALNFTVSNLSNDTANLVLGLIDQAGTQVTGFGAVGSPLTTTPPTVVVAIDDGGGSANGAFDDGSDTELTPNANGLYALPAGVAADGTVQIVVAIEVDGGEGNDVYQAYTLVAGVADGSNVPLQTDDSGNVAPGSGATPSNVANGLTTVETVWADAASANAEDEQFDFFSTTAGLGTSDAVADGQSADSSGFVTGVALSLAKYAEVIFDPVTGNRYDADRSTVLGDPKAIPGAVIMYVLGIANENAALTADAVTLGDTLPTEVTAGNQTGLATLVIPSSATFAVGSGSPIFDLTAVTDLDVVSSSACSTPTSTPAYTGGPPATGLAGDVGNCAASDTAYVVYFVTLD
ncbi:MAG: hypothetical protein ACR2PZ_24810 [Pseudomonadales bacterium]